MTCLIGCRLCNNLSQQTRVIWRIYQLIHILAWHGPVCILCLQFLGPHGGEPSPWFGFGKGFYSHLPGLPEISLLDLVRVTRVCLFVAVALGLSWYDLFAYGVAMASLHLRYSIIFFLNNGKGVISVCQGPYLLTWEFLSFLYVWIPC